MKLPRFLKNRWRADGGAAGKILTCLAVWLAGTIIAAPPDLTAPGTVVDTKLTYNLGPTGARGWIYYQKPDAAPVMTRDSRQILVASIEAGSPAAGVLQVGDVIVGVNGSLFTTDCRKRFGMAIGEAEAGTGALNLMVWRAGSVSNRTVQLAFTGLPYAATAPYQCAKSARILAEGCAYIVARNDWSEVNLGAMALLASGNPAYASLIQTKMRAGILNAATLELYKTGEAGVSAWNAGYKGWTMAEYFLATGDPTVLPTIEAYAVVSARGRGKFGTFGHGGMSEKNPDGSLHGPVAGYGPMNQSTMPNIISMILAKKCGVTHPEIDPAIAVASNFYSFYCDKGLIPYGEHVPSLTANEDNGRQALAAVMFSFDPAKNYQTNYFTRMAMASGDQREGGHTGPFFGYLWEPLGVNVGGPAAMADYFHDLAWWYDLNRRWDGSFAYVEGDGSPAGLTYRGWTITPAMMLHFAVPLKQLYITGKNLAPALQLTATERAESLAASKFTLEHAAAPKTTAQLIAALSSFSPAIRNNWAAEYLAADPARPSVAQLSAWATGTDSRLAEGACATLGFLQDPTATPALTSLLSSSNRSLRIIASQALDNMNESARPAAVDMLNAIVANQAPLDPLSVDPLQQAQSELSNALFYDNTGLLSQSFTGYDRGLVLDAMRVLIKAPDSWSRRCVSPVLDLLTFGEVQALGQDLLDATEYKAPANGMFSKSIRIAGSKTLAKWRTVEGIPIIMDLLEVFQWGKDWFQGQELNALLEYGGSLNFMPGPDLNIYNRIFAIEDFWLDKAGPTDEHVVTARRIRELLANDPSAQALVYLLNQAPVANDAAFWVYENRGIGSNVGTVLANDIVPSDTLTYAITAGNTAGAFAIHSATGAITVAGALNHATNPTYNLTVTVTDSGLLTDTAAVTITVQPVNHGSNQAPVVNDQAFALSENISIGTSIGTVVATDPNPGDIRTYSITAGNVGGAFAINPLTGQLTVAGIIDFETIPSYVLTVSVTDGLLTDTAAISVAVNNVNDAPVATAQTVTTAEDTAKAITLSGTDIELSPLTYAIVTPPEHGILSGTAPNLTYTPAANYTGPDSFAFKANDGALNSAAATVAITVTPVNDAPVALAQSVTVPQNVASKIWLIGDDVEGSTLTYTSVTQPAHGTVTNGSKVTYTPATNFSGTDSFTFKCSDGALYSNIATVTITVTGGSNSAPVALAQSVSTPEDTAKAITLVATDANGDPLNYTIVAQPASGTLSGTAPNVLYTPAPNYTGTASFTFKASDGSVESATATVTITISGDNDAPVASAQSVSTAMGVAKPITLTATDADGTPLTYAIVAPPAHGTLTGTAPNLTYTPATSYTGTDQFTFKANDGSLDSAEATVEISVTSSSNWQTTDIGTGMLAGSLAMNGGTFTQSGSGLLTGSSDKFRFTYQILAGVGEIIARVPVFQNTGNNSRVGVMIRETLATGSKYVMMGLTSSNGYRWSRRSTTDANQTSTIYGTGTAPNYWVRLLRVGGTITGYTSADGAAWTLTGTSTMTLTTNVFVGLAVDSGSDTTLNTSQFDNVTLTGGLSSNQAPVATAQSVSTPEDTAKAITLAASDPEGSALTYAVVTPPATGTLTGTAPNLTYTPAPNYHGTVSFTFKASDGTNDSAAATVTLTVTPLNDPPVVIDGSFAINEGSSVGTTVGTVSAIDPDAPDPLTYAITAGNIGGVFAIHSTTGLITVASGLDFETTPSYELTVTVTDAGLLADTANITITVDDVNEVPQAIAQTISTVKGSAKALILAAIDVDGDPLTYEIAIPPAHGTLSGTAPNLTYTPAAGYSGGDSFSFIANDGIFDSEAATIGITVTVGTFSTWASANNVTSGETGDTDNDGITNRDEYLIGTDPSHPSPPILTVAKGPGNTCVLSFLARAASGIGYEGLTRKYDLQASSDLAPASWQNVSGSTDIVGAGQNVVIPFPIEPPRKYYRLKVRVEEQ